MFPPLLNAYKELLVGVGFRSFAEASELAYCSLGLNQLSLIWARFELCHGHGPSSFGEVGIFRRLETNMSHTELFVVNRWHVQDWRHCTWVLLLFYILLKLYLLVCHLLGHFFSL